MHAFNILAMVYFAVVKTIMFFFPGWFPQDPPAAPEEHPALPRERESALQAERRSELAGFAEKADRFFEEESRETPASVADNSAYRRRIARA
ncbi:uncharacterized protein RCC_07981 [Ramularia collo-cygni]|uniref:Uncharacterized protein n=1 Tax=Ramularia collo-cygni TaxID=112498 RepID=A0A2D3UWC8_9PEZI|nr:uncharacterized protein RCC_07981 [Ramularia collo-cygni]CZT22112.1 uncharacterized protein RCC_07981 [Ramularia collo-cygni]